jgi:hypothetical protein
MTSYRRTKEMILLLLTGSGVCCLAWALGGPAWLLSASHVLLGLVVAGLTVAVVLRSPRLLALSAIVSLALCAGVLGLWLRSYRVNDIDGWYINHWEGLAGNLRAWGVCSDSGGLSFFALRRTFGPGEDPERVSDFKISNPEGSQPGFATERPCGYPYMRDYAGWGRFGFGLFWGDRSPPSGYIRLVCDDRFVVVPYWLFVLVFAALPAWRLTNCVRGRRVASRLRAGLCLSCGYDLRFTPERCPECGRVPTPKETSLA